MAIFSYSYYFSSKSFYLSNYFYFLLRRRCWAKNLLMSSFDALSLREATDALVVIITVGTSSSGSLVDELALPLLLLKIESSSLLVELELDLACFFCF